PGSLRKFSALKYFNSEFLMILSRSMILSLFPPQAPRILSSSVSISVYPLLNSFGCGSAALCSLAPKSVRSIVHPLTMYTPDTKHPFMIRSHGSIISRIASRITHHASRVTHHASRITHHVFTINYQL